MSSNFFCALQNLPRLNDSVALTTSLERVEVEGVEAIQVVLAYVICYEVIILSYKVPFYDLLRISYELTSSDVITLILVDFDAK